MMSEDRSVSRAALGNSASLGDLYDARTDDFCGISIFKREIPENARVLIDSQFSDIHLVSTEAFSEKVSKLGVSAELQVSVLGGLFNLQGSGRYLNDHKRSSRSVQSSLVYNIKTKQESVNIYHEDLRQAFAIDAIESGVATHVVVGIEWGANSIITCQYENRENRDVTEIAGNLAAQLKSVSLSISGKATADFKDGDTESGVKFDVRMYGDILPKNGELPTTFGEALELMKKLPSLVDASNNGKGKPLTYRLIPISLLKKYLNFSIQADAMIKSLEETSLVRVVQLFDEMSKAQQQLNDFCEDAYQFKNCMLPDELKEIAQLKNETQIQETSFRSELGTVLTKIRSGKMEVSKLEELIQKHQTGSVSPEKMSTKLSSWNAIVARINFARLLAKHGATFIGFETSLDEEILKNYEAKCFILYFSPKFKTEHPEVWGGNWQVFLQEMKKKVDNHKFFAVDCDIHSSYAAKFGRTVVQVVQTGQVVVEDLLEELKRLNQISFVQSISDAKFPNRIPNRLAPLTMFCPGKYCNRVKTHDWNCKLCLEKVEYGFDDLVYCGCGMVPVMALEFKCSDPKHGQAFNRHDKEYFQHVLSSLRPFGAINILVLGETQEERLLWIREFGSFLTCNVTEHLSKQDPSKTLVESAQHSSGSPKVHSFGVGSTTVRLMDSPDVAKEDINTQILKKFIGGLSYIEDIHGICILVNTESASVDVDTMFQACCTELKNCFGQRARKNVVFATRNSGVQLNLKQETLLRLKKLVYDSNEKQMTVSEKTVFFFGNKTCEFTALKDDSTSQLTKVQLEYNKNGYKENAVEAIRLLHHVRLLPLLPISGRVETLLQTEVRCRDILPGKAVHLPVVNGLHQGDAINVYGWPSCDGAHFLVTLFCHQENCDIALQIDSRLYDNVVVFTAKNSTDLESAWGPYLILPDATKTFIKEQPFHLKIVCELDKFQIFVDGKHFADYGHRYPAKLVRSLQIFNDIYLTSVEIIRA